MTTKKELKKLSKAELIARGEELGLKTKGLKKDDLVTAIYEIEKAGNGKACDDMYTKALEAVAKFLKKRGFEIIARDRSGFAFICIDDEQDAIAFIEFTVRKGGFPVEGAVSNKQRMDYEHRLADFLEDYEGPEAGVTVHKLCMNVLSNNRAMLRMYRNVLAPANK